MRARVGSDPSLLRFSAWRRRCAAFLIITAGLLTLLTGARATGLILWEGGLSMPTGIYMLQPFAWPPARGDVVVTRHAPGWSRPYLMKRVAGIGGDVFCWHAERHRHRLGSRWMPAPTPEAAALDIPIWTGCRTLAADEVAGFGDYPDSYDSRYFGPLKTAALEGVYHLVLPLPR